MNKKNIEQININYESNKYLKDIVLRQRKESRNEKNRNKLKKRKEIV